MAKEKKVIFEEINMVEDTPDDLVMELFVRGVLAGPPARPADPGDEAHASGRFRREDLASYFARVYHPANILIAAAGHLEHAAVAGLVRAALLRLCARARVPGNGHAPRAEARARSRARSASWSRCTSASARAPARRRTRTATRLYVLNTVLGGSMSSRLFQNIREKRGLVYSISSGVSAYSDAGLLSIYAGTSLDSAPEVIRLTLEEIRRLRGDRLPDEELRRAKDHLKGGLVLSLESTGARMSHLARQEIYYGRQVTARRDPGRASRRSSADDVQRDRRRAVRRPDGASVLGNLQGWRPRDKESSWCTSLRFRVLGSGSGGNATLVEGGRRAGAARRGPRPAPARGAARRPPGVDPASLDAVLVSHEHGDHARGAAAFAAKWGVPLAGTRGTFAAAGFAAAKLPALRGARARRDPHDPRGSTVRAVAVPHDAARPARLRALGAGALPGPRHGPRAPRSRPRRRPSAAATPSSSSRTTTPAMLRDGPYPWSLKERILGPLGHLSNGDVARLLERGLGEACRRVVLAHLSRKNNHPELALLAAEEALRRAGRRT